MASSSLCCRCSWFRWASGPTPLELSSKTWLFLGLSGLATGASWVCYFWALKIGDASKVAPVDKLSLVLVAVFACAFLDEPCRSSNECSRSEQGKRKNRALS
ncbi:EamA family transporter [Janthinobacterium sp. ROICE36]|uniref:EamA family transporter n=1 Tax=Janthinobacterium sp. ROICE36 TaxID=2048670 RepID=UPI002155BD46|nr:EamA family transporter [Janthinobacterium sp. ROICE36]